MTFSRFISNLMGTPGSFIINVIDIAIVAYIIYMLLKLVVNTRSGYILRGIAMLVVVYILAKYLEMQMMGWILDRVWLMLIVALPVVFQPELRSFLERLGEADFLKRRGNNARKDEEGGDLVKELAEMAESLSKVHVGALIAIERKGNVEAHLVGRGTEIDAKVTAPLLINIFEPNTPLHDGAVIIRRNRIYRAATILPLTANPNVDKSLGTRHRAGIGISEMTDAIVLIVSEETGIISIAEDGKIFRRLEGERLRKMLTDGLWPSSGKENDKKNFLKRLKGTVYGSNQKKKP